MKTKAPLNFNFGNGIATDKGRKDKVEAAANLAPEPEIVHHTPFDHDERFSVVKAELSFTVIKNKLIEMSGKAKALDVKDDKTNSTAMEMLVQCKALVKAADKARKGIPAYEAASKFKSGVDTFIREQLKKPIEKIERLINPKVGSYQKAQAELQRRIAQKAAEAESKRIAEETRLADEAAQKEHDLKVKEAAELQARLNEEADSAGVSRVQVDVPEFVEPETIIPSMVSPIVKQTEKVVTAQGSSVIKPKFVCVVIDPDKVPRQYCQPNQKALDAAVEAGVRQINGCRIEEVFEAKVRMSSARRPNPFVDDGGGLPM